MNDAAAPAGAGGPSGEAQALTVLGQGCMAVHAATGITDPGLPERQPAPLPAGWAPPRREPPDLCTLARVHAALTALADPGSHPDATQDRPRTEARYRAGGHEEHGG
jgi:hypothetical protein